MHWMVAGFWLLGQAVEYAGDASVARCPNPGRVSPAATYLAID
jgi:hypothetical protein